MKLKNLFLTLGLAAVLGIGAGVGLTNKQNSREVKAATEETTFYVDVTDSFWGAGNINNVKIHLWGEDIGDVYIYDNGTGRSFVTISDVTYVSFSIADHVGAIGFEVYCWDMNAEGNVAEWTEFSAFAEGQNLISVGSSDSWQTRQPVTLGTLKLPEIFTVTKTAIEFSNGVATGNTWTIGSESVEEGATYEVPASPDAVNLEHFVGWYSDETCETALVPQTITAATTIYAKFNKLTVDSYFYWISESSEPVFDHVYFFNEYQTTVWPGDEIADYEVSGVLTFNGLSQKIYKIPVPSEGDVAVILNDANDKQTYDMYDIERRAGYYTWLKAGEGKYSYNANSDAGAALDLLLRAENIRNGVRKDDGAPADYSVCGISASDAASLYNEYFALSDGAKGMVDNTTTYTYNGTDVDPEHQTGVSYQAIMNQLREIAQKGGQTVSASNSFGVNENDFTAIIVVVIAITSVLACGTMLIIKRRKQLNK